MQTHAHTHTNKAQELQSRIRALNNEIFALNGHQGIDDTRWHSVSTLPTESAFLVVEAIDYLKSTMPVDELVKKMDDFVQLRWHLDAQLLQSVAQAAKADFTARDDLKVLGTGDVGKIEDWYKETYDAIVLARELQVCATRRTRDFALGEGVLSLRSQLCGSSPTPETNNATACVLCPEFSTTSEVPSPSARMP